jgi:hypothetical protein
MGGCLGWRQLGQVAHFWLPLPEVGILIFCIYFRGDRFSREVGFLTSLLFQIR